MGSKLPAGILSQDIMNGGLILQEITPEAFELRLFYFSESGLAANLLAQLRPRDLIQFCWSTRRILISRENVYFDCRDVKNRELFETAINFFREDIYRRDPDV